MLTAENRGAAGSAQSKTGLARGSEEAPERKQSKDARWEAIRSEKSAQSGERSAVCHRGRRVRTGAMMVALASRDVATAPLQLCAAHLSSRLVLHWPLLADALLSLTQRPAVDASTGAEEWRGEGGRPARETGGARSHQQCRALPSLPRSRPIESDVAPGVRPASSNSREERRGARWIDDPATHPNAAAGTVLCLTPNCSPSASQSCRSLSPARFPHNERSRLRPFRRRDHSNLP